MNCTFEWMAPLARPEMIRYPDGREVLATHMPQRCCLAPGHKGPHRSLDNVTCEQVSILKTVTGF